MAYKTYYNVNAIQIAVILHCLRTDDKRKSLYMWLIPQTLKTDYIFEITMPLAFNFVFTDIDYREDRFLQAPSGCFATLICIVLFIACYSVWLFVFLCNNSILICC